MLHEVLRELFAKRPDLIAPLLERRLHLPAADMIAIDSELTDPRMTQLLPDVVLACPSAEAPLVIVIVEVHLEIAEVKRRVWPQYTATAHGRYRCAVLLVVVTPSKRVERWARRPIEIGPGHTMTPHVLGPKALPRLDAAEVKRSPALAMLSTLANVGDPACAEQALETLEALATWDEDADGRLGDILQAVLPKAVRRRMEMLMRRASTSTRATSRRSTSHKAKRRAAPPEKHGHSSWSWARAASRFRQPLCAASRRSAMMHVSICGSVVR